MYILKPSFFDDFHCIGKDCQYTCCQGWKIVVEENKYQQYLSYLDELGEADQKCASYDKEQNGYVLEFNEKGLCPFCDEKQLCRLVIGQGEDALCNICHTFPRESVITSDTEEQFLSLACPQVAVLLEKVEGPLSFIMEEDERIISDYSKMSRSEREKERQLVEKIDFDRKLRNRLIDVLQDRQYPLWFRQFSCIYSMDKIKELHRRDERSAAAETLEEILTASYQQQLFRGLDAIETDKYRKFVQLQQLFLIFCGMIEKVAKEDKDESGKRAEELIELNNSCTFEQYMEAYKEWEEREAEAFDILMEHATVCNWFGYALVAMNEYYLFDNSIDIVLEQLLIKHSMILYYSKYREMPKETRAFLIAVCTRIISHGRKSMAKAIHDMKEKNMLSIDNMFLLLK